MKNVNETEKKTLFTTFTKLDKVKKSIKNFQWKIFKKNDNLVSHKSRARTANEWKQQKSSFKD